MVTVVDFGTLTFLFPGDLEAPGWQVLLQRQDFLAACERPGHWRVLVAAHHGHVSGVYKPFLDLFKPDITLISGPYGDEHTDRATYEACSAGCVINDSGDNTCRSCKVLTTKTNTYVRITSDGTEPPYFFV
jgi:hypothetical protein